MRRVKGNNITWFILVIVILQVVQNGNARKSRKIHRGPPPPEVKPDEEPDYTQGLPMSPPVPVSPPVPMSPPIPMSPPVPVSPPVPMPPPVTQLKSARHLGKGILLLTKTFLLLSNEMKAMTTNLQQYIPNQQAPGMMASDDSPLTMIEVPPEETTATHVEPTEAPVPEPVEIIIETTEEPTTTTVEPTTEAPVVTTEEPTTLAPKKAKTHSNKTPSPTMKILDESRKLISDSQTILANPLAHIAQTLQRIPKLVSRLTSHTSKLAARQSRGR